MSPTCVPSMCTERQRQVGRPHVAHCVPPAQVLTAVLTRLARLERVGAAAVAREVRKRVVDLPVVHLVRPADPPTRTDTRTSGCGNRRGQPVRVQHCTRARGLTHLMFAITSRIVASGASLQ